MLCQITNGRERFWDRLSIPSTRAQSLAYLPKTVAYARRCGALSGRLLAHVSSTDDARDLDYPAPAGGRPAAHLLGGVVRHVSRRDLRQHVSPSGACDGSRRSGRPSNRDQRRGGEVLEHRSSRWIAGCERSSRCASEPDRTAARSPAAAPWPRGWPGCWRGCGARRSRRPTATPPGALSYGDLSAVLLASLTNPAAWPQLAQDLEQAANGDGSALATQARAVLAGTRSAAGDSPTAITCTDSPARQGPGAWPQVIARLTRVSLWAGPFVGWSSWAPCASWPSRAADRYTGPWNAHTKNPILVIGTTFDPATPYTNARRVADLLGNAVLLTHDGYGHTSEADPSHCVEQATSTYLVDLTTPTERNRMPIRPTTVRPPIRPTKPPPGAGSIAVERGSPRPTLLLRAYWSHRAGPDC